MYIHLSESRLEEEKEYKIEDDPWMSRQVTCFCEQSLNKKIVQKLYKIYTKIKQNTYFVYVLYTKIVQIKILFDNECTKNVHKIPPYIQKMYKLYKTCLERTYS